MIIAIDGPAGSGKSTTASVVAERLGFVHLDSGAFYRTLTLAALRAEIPEDEWPELDADELEQLDVRVEVTKDGICAMIGEEDVTDEIRSPEVNARVSRMARVPVVRGWLLEQLRETAHGTDLVADGRDIGTVVFPNAELKVFLTADPEERARRRLAQEGTSDPDPETVRRETEQLLARDRMDRERETAPLKKAHDAVELDTTDLDFEAQVARIVELATSAVDRG